MNIDTSQANFKSSMTLLLVKVDGGGTIKFTRNPEIEINGTGRLAGLGHLQAGIRADLQLRDPSATVSGSVGLPPIGDIKFGADATMHSAVLKASIIGITASLVLPSLGDLNAGLLPDPVGADRELCHITNSGDEIVPYQDRGIRIKLRGAVLGHEDGRLAGTGSQAGFPPCWTDPAGAASIVDPVPSWSSGMQSARSCRD
jgi:hypothetical protein